MKPKIHISLRVSILTVYATTFIVLMATLIILSALYFFHSMVDVSDKLLTDVSSVVLEKLRLELKPAESIIKLSKPLLNNGTINDQNIVDYTLYVAENLPRYQLPNAARIAAWGDAKGNSYETSLETDGTYSTAIIRPYDNPPLHVRLYRDAKNQIIKREEVPANYDPRVRPWYITAANAKNFSWTDFFLSYPYRNPSTAAVIPIYNAQQQLTGVFEIEVKLVGLSDFLTKLQFAEDGIAFIVNGKNQLVAFPGMKKWMGENLGNAKPVALKTIGKPWLNAALDQFNKTHQHQFEVVYHHTRYFAHFLEIPEFSHFGWKIGVVVPEDSLVGSIKRKNAFQTGIGVGILILGLVIASFFSKQISKPMSNLVDETQQIRDLHLEGGKTGESIIKEVDSLANAIYSMKINLRSFQKYMPAKLVRQLIQSGQDIQLGAEKQTLTVLFTDIKDFTTLAETIAPEFLMQHLSTYLDELSIIISKQEGTIDKYIGDSIMAFWGAPLPDVDHCQHACTAALKCKNKLSELNSSWKKQDKPVLTTRFGIHTGDVLVGNIGATDRFNYTTLGDVVNTTSRLEGLNKIYGTTIIASEEVVKIVGENFIFRMIDHIAVKGRYQVSIIYELLAEKMNQLSFDLTAYQKVFDQGFQAYQHQQWREAIESFKQCLQIYPEDSVAHVFISRCESFMKRPPAANWDGIWRASEK